MTTVATVALSALLSVSIAQAKQPSKDEIAEAQRHFQRATELYEENNLAGALAEFRRAYATAPTYKILYNVGQLCYLLQDFPCAFDNLSRYLVQGGNEIPAARREEVQRDVLRLQSRVAKVRIIADRPGAEVAIDNVAVGRTPLPEPVLVAAGRPQIRLTLAGYAPVTRMVEVAGMETATVEVSLAPTGYASSAATIGAARLAGGPPTVAAQARSREIPLVPWIITGTLAVAAGTAGGLALWSSSDLKSRRNEVPSDPTELNSKSSRTKGLALATDILIGATVVAAGVATYMTVTAPSRSDGVAIILGPGAVGVRGTF
jgi:hypothetical protein